MSKAKAKVRKKSEKPRAKRPIFFKSREIPRGEPRAMPRANFYEIAHPLCRDFGEG